MLGLAALAVVFGCHSNARATPSEADLLLGIFEPSFHPTPVPLGEAGRYPFGHLWPHQVGSGYMPAVLLLDGRVVLGFAGDEPRFRFSRAMAGLRDAEHQFRFPSVSRHGGHVQIMDRFGQALMMQLPDGSRFVDSGTPQPWPNGRPLAAGGVWIHPGGAPPEVKFKSAFFNDPLRDRARLPADELYQVIPGGPYVEQRGVLPWAERHMFARNVANTLGVPVRYERMPAPPVPGGVALGHIVPPSARAAAALARGPVTSPGPLHVPGGLRNAAPLSGFLGSAAVADFASGKAWRRRLKVR